MFCGGVQIREGGPNPLADMYRGGPNPLADLDRGVQIRGGSKSAVTPACSLQNEVGDPPFFFTFLTKVIHHLTVVKISEKNKCWKIFARTSLNERKPFFKPCF